MKGEAHSSGALVSRKGGFACTGKGGFTLGTIKRSGVREPIATRQILKRPEWVGSKDIDSKKPFIER